MPEAREPTAIRGPESWRWSVTGTRTAAGSVGSGEGVAPWMRPPCRGRVSRAADWTPAVCGTHDIL